jgi:hypothetical protein
MPLAQHDIIQIAPPHKWGGCVVVVDAITPTGCRAYALLPKNDGSRPAPAFVDLNAGEWTRVFGTLVYQPTDGGFVRPGAHAAESPRDDHQEG